MVTTAIVVRAVTVTVTVTVTDIMATLADIMVITVIVVVITAIMDAAATVITVITVTMGTVVADMVTTAIVAVITAIMVTAAMVMVITDTMNTSVAATVIMATASSHTVGTVTAITAIAVDIMVITDTKVTAITVVTRRSRANLVMGAPALTATAIGDSSLKTRPVMDGEAVHRARRRVWVADQGAIVLQDRRWVAREPVSARLVQVRGHTLLAIAASQVDLKVGLDTANAMPATGKTSARGRQTASRRWRASSMPC
jgi:hypothetical protein